MPGAMRSIEIDMFLSGELGERKRVEASHSTADFQSSERLLVQRQKLTELNVWHIEKTEEREGNSQRLSEQEAV